jgi:PII-like signaling protein
MSPERVQRVRVYLTEDVRAGGHPLDRALLELLRREGARGATVFRGLEGFGASRRVHADLLVDVPPRLPLVVEWIDGAERVVRLLPAVAALAAGALATVDALELAAGPGPAPVTDGEGPRPAAREVSMEGFARAKRVRIYLHQGDRGGHGPAHRELLELLRAEGALGVTAFGGIEGFGHTGEVHGDHLADLVGRKLPLVLEWVDRPEVVERLLPAVQARVPEGMITVEDTAFALGPRRSRDRA